MSKTIKKNIRQSDIALTGLTRGNDVGFKFTIKTPTALSAARLVFKEQIGGSDPGIVSKFVTPAPSADGQILDTGLVNGFAVILFTVSKTQSDDFVAGKKYVWDVETFDVSNNANTPRGGTVVFNERVRTAVG